MKKIARSLRQHRELILKYFHAQRLSLTWQVARARIDPRILLTNQSKIVNALRKLLPGVYLLAMSLPACADAIRIMPLGDSITLGGSIPAGYRAQLYSDLSLAGFSVTLVGTQTANSNALLDANGQQHHEGHSGALIHGEFLPAPYNFFDDGLDEHLGEYMGPAGANHPDLILLMIGTNDVNLDVDFPNAPARLGALLDHITTLEPNAAVFVATIIPIVSSDPSKNARAISFNTSIANNVVPQHAALGQHVVLADLYPVLNTSTDYLDALHPNHAGYVKLGDAWAAAVETNIPEASSSSVAALGLAGLLGLRIRRGA